MPDTETSAKLLALENQLSRVMSVLGLSTGFLDSPQITESLFSLRAVDSDRYYLAGSLNSRPSASSIAMAIDTLYAIPFYCARPITIDNIAVSITVAPTVPAASSVRVGVYDVADKSSLYPGRLTSTLGTIPLTLGIGVREFTLVRRETLPRGLSYIVLHIGSLDGSIQLIDPISQLSILGVSNTFAQMGAAWEDSASYVAGILPESFPTGANRISNVPAVGVRAISLGLS